MDPKAQMPAIKTEVNKVDDGKKKSSGLLGGLFGGGGSGAAGGLGGLGAGAAGGGGMLATKAGMLALALMGSAVAGGIGLAGYKMFGPGDADRTGGNLSLFAPKPEVTVDPNAVAPVNADGSSASLDMMAQSAAKDKAAEGADAAAAAPTDQTAGDAAKDAAAAEAARKAAEAAKNASNGPINSGGGAGAVGSFGKGGSLGKKFGALSGVTGGGGGSSTSSGMAGRLGDGMANASRNGKTSGFSSGGAASKASSAKGMAGRRGRNARSEARRVLGDQGGGKALSSFGAGKTYDGSAGSAGGNIGVDNGIGMPGAGDGTGVQPKSLAANSVKNQMEQEPPIPKAKHMIQPWETALQRIQLMAIAALILGVIGSKLSNAGPWGKAASLVIAAVITAMAAYAAYLAIKMMSGPNAQVMQGVLALATAAGMGVMAGMVISGAKAFDGDGMLGGIQPIMLAGGGLLAIGLIGSMLAPKPTPIDANATSQKDLDDSDVKGLF